MAVLCRNDLSKIPVSQGKNELTRHKIYLCYKPKPARKVEISKEDGKTRPISIYCYEDKLVQEALRRILEAVFEPHFYDEMNPIDSYSFLPIHLFMAFS